MSEIVGAFLGSEGLQEFSDVAPCYFTGSLVCPSDGCLQLCEHHLDGIEIWAVVRQEEELRADHRILNFALSADPARLPPAFFEGLAFTTHKPPDGVVGHVDPCSLQSAGRPRIVQSDLSASR